VTTPPWSYSSLTKYETCPKQYELTKVTKQVIEPPTVHTIWGQEVHLALEERIRDNKPLGDNFTKYESVAAKIEAIQGEKHCEHQFAFNSNLELTDWDSPDAWCRGIIDIWIHGKAKAVAYDYKTGKVKSDSDQLKLFAAFIMQAYPEIEAVSTGFIWLAHNKVTVQTFTRDDLPAIWEDFTQRSLRLKASYDNGKWIPKPSGLCRGWCSAGKLCEFWSPKR